MGGPARRAYGGQGRHFWLASRPEKLRLPRSLVSLRGDYRPVDRFRLRVRAQMYDRPASEIRPDGDDPEFGLSLSTLARASGRFQPRRQRASPAPFLVENRNADARRLMISVCDIAKSCAWLGPRAL
jgi:hypothetical protein